MTAAPEVIVVGEPLIALLAAGAAPLADVESFSRHVAGAEANVAVGLARLGHSVLYVGRVGEEIADRLFPGAWRHLRRIRFRERERRHVVHKATSTNAQADRPS